MWQKKHRKWVNYNMLVLQPIQLEKKQLLSAVTAHELSKGTWRVTYLWLKYIMFVR